MDYKRDYAKSATGTFMQTKKSKVATEMRDKHQKAFEDKYGCNMWLKVFIGVYMED